MADHGHRNARWQRARAQLVADLHDMPRRLTARSRALRLEAALARFDAVLGVVAQVEREDEQRRWLDAYMCELYCSPHSETSRCGR